MRDNRAIGARNRRAGKSRERDVFAYFRGLGYVCAWSERREPAFDFMAARFGKVTLVEVKSTKHPFDTFGPDRRSELLKSAAQAGAFCILAHWPFDGKGKSSLRMYGPSEWPGNNVLVLQPRPTPPSDAA